MVDYTNYLSDSVDGILSKFKTSPIVIENGSDDFVFNP